MTSSPLTLPEHDAHPDPVLLAVIADDPMAEFDAIGPDPADADDPCTEAALRQARQHVAGCALCTATVSRYAGHAMLLAASSASDATGGSQGFDGEAPSDARWLDGLIERARDPDADFHTAMSGEGDGDEQNVSPSVTAAAAAVGVGTLSRSFEPPRSDARVVVLARRPYQRAGWFAAAGVVLVAAIGIGGLASRVDTGRDENAATRPKDTIAQDVIAAAGGPVAAGSAETATAEAEGADADALTDGVAETTAAAVVAETAAAEAAAEESSPAPVEAEEQQLGNAPGAATNTPSGDDAPPLAELDPSGDAAPGVIEGADAAPNDRGPGVDEAGAIAESAPSAAASAAAPTVGSGVTTTVGPTPRGSRAGGRDLGVLDAADSVDDALAALFARAVAAEPDAFGRQPPQTPSPSSIARREADRGTRVSAAVTAAAIDRCTPLLVRQSPTATRFIAVAQVGDRVLVLGLSGTTGSGTVVILESRTTSCQLVERRPF